MGSFFSTCSARTQTVGHLQQDLQQGSSQQKIDSQDKIKSTDNFQSSQKQKSLKITNYYKQKELDPLKFYDKIYNIISLSNLNLGAEIQNCSSQDQVINAVGTPSLILVGVIGLYKKGKSFILSRLCSFTLPSGENITTKGLSIKYPQKGANKIALMDSEGLETPIKIFPKEDINQLKDPNFMKQLKEQNTEVLGAMARDRLYTEYFLQNFLIENSDYLILVVGILTYSEQKLINKIKRNIKNQLEDLKYQNKTIYIIHNLYYLTEVKEVENYLDNTLKKCFQLQQREFKIKIKDIILEKDQNMIYFTEDYQSNQLQIIHLVLGCQEQKSGDQYNNNTFKFLQSQLQARLVEQEFKLEDRIKKSLMQASKMFFDDKWLIKEEADIKIDDKMIKICYKNDDQEQIQNEQIQLKKVFLDQIGGAFLVGDEYQPAYCTYFDNRSKELIIEIEIHGITNCLVDSKLSGQILNISIFGEIKEISLPGFQTYMNKQEQIKKFSLDIKYPVYGDLYDEFNEEFKDEQNSGILKIKFQCKSNIFKKNQPDNKQADQNKNLTPVDKNQKDQRQQQDEQVIDSEIQASLNFYDLIIMINSLDITKGWKLYSNDQAERQREKTIDEFTSRVASVLGTFNKGKSWILSKLCETNLPQGHSITTQGISIKYPLIKDEQNIILLDTAGFETPIKLYTTNSNKNSSFEEDCEKLTQKARERQLTEQFIQSFLINISDILILVVGYLTYSDQILINKIKQLQTRQRIYIVHNLKNIIDKEDVEKYIDDVIRRIFRVTDEQILFDTLIKRDQKDQENAQNQFTCYFKEIEKQVIHLVVANEESEAGAYYNDSAFYFLQVQICSFAQQKKVKILDSLTDFLVKQSELYFEQESQIQDEDIQIEKNIIQLKDNSKKITQKTPYCDEIGSLKLKSEVYSPNYIILQNEEERKFVIIVEISGKSQIEDIKRIVKQYNEQIFKINGKKLEWWKAMEKPIENIKDQKEIYIISDNRPKNSFEITIQLRVDEKYILGNVKKQNYKEGFLYYEIPYRTQNEKQGRQIKSIQD